MENINTQIIHKFALYKKIKCKNHISIYYIQKKMSNILKAKYKLKKKKKELTIKQQTHLITIILAKK